MPTQTVTADFGAEKIQIEVPAEAVVVEFEDPPYPASAAEVLANALRNPAGAPPLSELAANCTTVAIAFDDPTRPPAPWQLMLPAIVEVLRGAGIRDENIRFICANGTHKKWSEAELRAFVGEEVFTQFWPRGAIVNHDCEDPDNLLDLGQTPMGGVVEHNRMFLEADLNIYVGQVMAHSWGGYTGTGAAIGLASTRSVCSHHAHRVVNHPETTTGEHKQMMFRRMKAEINAHIEQHNGRRIFYVNWVGGTRGQIADIVAGYSPEVEPPAWEAADKFSRIEVPQADILVVGMPASFAYGDANNPLIAAIGMAYPPRVWLGDHVLREGGVVIGLHPSNGTVDETTYPSYTEVMALYESAYAIHDLSAHQEAFMAREDYLERYRRGLAYHPVHPFWLMYSCDYVLSRASAVILAGTANPGVFRSLGITPARDFDSAMAMATRITGPAPVTVVAPTYWSRRPFKFDVKVAR